MWKRDRAVPLPVLDTTLTSQFCTTMKMQFGFANLPVDVEEERARIADERRRKTEGGEQRSRNPSGFSRGRVRQ